MTGHLKMTKKKLLFVLLVTAARLIYNFNLIRKRRLTDLSYNVI